MTAMTEERPIFENEAIFENEEWLVTGSGLEHKTTGYFIDRESIGNRREDGLWSWPLHMAEKTWCAMVPFAEAFSCATAVYRVETDAELAQTFKIARSEVASWPRREKQTFVPAPLVSQALHEEARNPILVEPRTSEKPLKGQGLRGADDVWRMRTKTGARPFSATAHFGSLHLSTRAAALPWRAPRRIRKTGTKLVRIIQAAWNIR